MASLGILAAARGPADVARVRRSLELLVRHQDELGRVPLKVDPVADRPVSENSAGVDAGLWLTIAAAGLAAHEGVDPALLRASERALHWTRHLDVDGDGLLETPEASDWADMMPHRHHVLFVNVLHVAALRAHAALTERAGGDATAFRARADDAEARINLAFWVEACERVSGVATWLQQLEDACPEWGITGQYASRWGSLPYYLPYLGFRVAGRHCDVVGNLLAVLAGVADDDRARRILDHLDAVGAAEPHTTRAIVPPLYPGDPDYRDHFQWRGLNTPHQYQNGGAWPFIGALHVAATVATGGDGSRLAAKLIDAVMDEAHPFPEWRHGRSGRPTGERDQLWSATGVLHALACLERPAAASLPGSAR
jgi:glycogen debranching enzyme